MAMRDRSKTNFPLPSSTKAEDSRLASGERKRQLLAGATSLLVLAAAPALAAEQAIPLKPGQGIDATTSMCAICHSLDYIRMNSVFLSPDGWKAEVTKMRAAYGAPIDDATADAIQHYLAAKYGTPPKS